MTWRIGPEAATVTQSPARLARRGTRRCGNPVRQQLGVRRVCESSDRPQLRDALGRSGAAFVRRTYSWPLVVEKYLDLFAEVSARNR